MNRLLLIIIIALAYYACSDRFQHATVQIESVTYLTHASAVANCNVEDDGGEYVDRKGVCWSTNTRPTLKDHASDRGTQGNGAYQSPLFSLHPNTVYFVRAFAVNSAGTSYSRELQIRTPEPEYLTDIRDNYKYVTVEIGQQYWMAENLSYHMQNGSWYYLNDSLHFSKRGKLYDWVSASQACPEGWKLPSMEDWSILEEYLGIPPNELTGFGCKGTNEAGKIKEPGNLNWFYEPGDITNETAFTAIPCGIYFPENKTFTDSTFNAYYWSSSSYNSNEAWCIKIGSMDNKICLMNSSKTTGMSIRCIKK